MSRVEVACESAPACPDGQFMYMMWDDCSCSSNPCDACPPGMFLHVMNDSMALLHFSLHSFLYSPTNTSLLIAQVHFVKMCLGTQFSAWIALVGHVMPGTHHVAATMAKIIARPTPRLKILATCRMGGFHVSANQQSC